MTPEKPTLSPRDTHLSRAKEHCAIGRDILDEVMPSPFGTTPLEYAMDNLLHAVEAIADALLEEKNAASSPAKPRTTPTHP